MFFEFIRILQYYGSYNSSKIYNARFQINVSKQINLHALLYNYFNVQCSCCLLHR